MKPEETSKADLRFRWKQTLASGAGNSEAVIQRRKSTFANGRQHCSDSCQSNQNREHPVWATVADAHERQLTGRINFLGETARNQTGASDSNVPSADILAGVMSARYRS